MSDLTSLEKRKLELLLQMGSGYVLNFSNNTLDAFFVESIGRSLYDEKYNHGSRSKANQMRGFWREESNPVVSRLLGGLLDYVESERLSEDAALIADCRKIVARLREGSPVAEVEAIAQMANERDLDVVAKAVLNLIEKNELVAGLDRLHTLTTSYLRKLCVKRGLTLDQGKPLHSVFGEYVRALHSAGHIQSKMTASILKALKEPLDAFNDVRNNQSLAHPNDLLNHEEAMLVFNHITSALRFLQELERRIERREQAAARQVPTQDDEIPF